MASLQRITQHADMQAQERPRSTDIRHESKQFGVWLTSREAMQFVPCPTLNAWYQWRRRHGIIPRGNGSVARADLERALRIPDGRRSNRFRSRESSR